MSRNKTKSIHQAVPYSLRTWVTEKDRKYWDSKKAGRGIVSYRHALSDLIDYFENVKFGRLAPNSKTLSYWAYAWGWDWRKVVRFFAYCLTQIETMWASFSVRAWVAKAKRATDQVKKSVYKARGKEFKEPAPDIKELEIKFIEAMADAAQPRNGAAYVAVLRKKLIEKDGDTILNFQTWLDDYMVKAKEAADAEKIEKFDFATALERNAVNLGIAKTRIWEGKSGKIDLTMIDGTRREYSKKELYYKLVEQGVIEAA